MNKKARAHTDRIAFYERVPLSAEEAQHLDTARLVIRIQANGNEEFAALYERYFDRVYTYLRVLLQDSHEAEDATQQVFIQVFEALPNYERRDKPFDAWLFTVARNYAVRQHRKLGRIEAVDPAELDDRREERDGGREEPGLGVLSWISDRDLTFLIDRLPPAQRQVLTLRFFLGLTPTEIAEILGCSQNSVSALQYRALQFLRDRLTALGREPGRHSHRPRMRRFVKRNHVLRRRRFALSP